MAENGLLEALQLLARLEAELLVQDRPGTRVRGEGVRLPLRPVESEHQLLPEPLPVGMHFHEPLQLVHELGIAASARSASMRSSSACIRTSSRRSASSRRLPSSASSPNGRPRHRVSASRRCWAARVTADRPSASSASRVRCSKSDRIDQTGIGVQRVTVRPAVDGGAGPERGAEARHVRPDGRRGSRRWIAVPQLVGDAFCRHRPAELEQEQRQQRPLACPAEPDRLSLANDFDRTEHAKLDRLASLHAGAFCASVEALSSPGYASRPDVRAVHGARTPGRRSRPGRGTAAQAQLHLHRALLLG